MQFHWWYVLLYALVPLVTDLILNVTETKKEIDAPDPVFFFGYLIWPVVFGITGIIFSIIFLYKGYNNYIVEPLRTKYKKHKWTVENAKALKQRKIV